MLRRNSLTSVTKVLGRSREKSAKVTFAFVLPTEPRIPAGPVSSFGHLVEGYLILTFRKKKKKKKNKMSEANLGRKRI